MDTIKQRVRRAAAATAAMRRTDTTIELIWRQYGEEEPGYVLRPNERVIDLHWNNAASDAE